MTYLYYLDKIYLKTSIMKIDSDTRGTEYLLVDWSNSVDYNSFPDKYPTFLHYFLANKQKMTKEECKSHYTKKIYKQHIKILKKEGWKILGKTPPEMYVRWLLDGIKTGKILVNNYILRKEDLDKFKERWSPLNKDCS